MGRRWPVARRVKLMGYPSWRSFLNEKPEETMAAFNSPKVAEIRRGTKLRPRPPNGDARLYHPSEIEQWRLTVTRGGETERTPH